MDDLELHPLVRAAHTVADSLLAPQAAAVDAGDVPRSHLDAIGRAGLLGVSAPARLGGGEAPPAVARRVTEVLAGADLATWFVAVQHQRPLAALTAAPAFEALARDLARGTALSGVAFSHLRRWPDRPVRATRCPGGWRLDGQAPWYTGWGINDVMLLSGVAEDGTVVHAVVAAHEQPGLRAGAPMAVAALQAARTVTLDLDGLVVADADVVGCEPIASWLAADGPTAANVNPAVFGVAGSALDLLARAGQRRGEPAAEQAAARLASALDDVRARAYALIDDLDPQEGLEQRLALRAQAQQLMVQATTALVVSGAGASMARSAAAQRKAREAMFLLVQAQTRSARQVALDGFGR